MQGGMEPDGHSMSTGGSREIAGLSQALRQALGRIQQGSFPSGLGGEIWTRKTSGETE